MNNTHVGVARTSREALNCKNSASSNEYTDSTATKRQTPLMNKVYTLRSVLLRKIVGFACTSSLNPNDIQILILGAGLDTSYDQYSSHVFAVDFPDVISDRKASLTSVAIGADLTDAMGLIGKLEQAGFKFTTPTIILVECVLCYIEEQSCSQLLQILSSHIKSSIIVTYDPCLKSNVYQTNRFSQHMRSKFSERGAPLLNSHTNIHTVNETMYKCGWKHVITMNMNDASRLWLTEQEKLSKSGVAVEPFDEYASLAMLNNHYSVTIASTESTWFKHTVQSLSSGVSTIGSSNTSKREFNSERGSESRQSCVGHRLNKLMIRISVTENRLTGFETVIVRSSSNSKQTQQSGSISASSTTSTAFTLREATYEDSSALIQLYTTEFEDVANRYESVRKFTKNNLKPLRNIESFFSQKAGSRFYVATVNNNEIVGCIGIKLAYNTDNSAAKVTELSHLCVNKRYRGKGIGKALVQKVLDHCKGIHVDRVELTVLVDLIAARSLYEKMGFKVKERQDLGKGCQLEYMALHLGV